ncbi:twin-arginine translocation signal domain-containing protein [Paraburkholderia eburnea]|uniref:twin-arginine translocation signal domain-containing protein n=1 Tax=Paraburkholderia eburnea TaxID=1189126 RepID=UPI00389939E1
MSSRAHQGRRRFLGAAGSGGVGGVGGGTDESGWASCIRTPEKQSRDYSCPPWRAFGMLTSAEKWGRGRCVGTALRH